MIARNLFVKPISVMLLVVLFGHAEVRTTASGAERNTDAIRPYEDNPRYWQYQGRPVLLLGGSNTDHLFLMEGLREHLDEIAACGANYVRNTMSQREGVELKPHLRLPSGKFDLDQWNDGYWRRFADALRWCGERDIVMQIEVWDRFDFSQEHWQNSPWNPKNNVNYTHAATGLAANYPAHPSRDRQPFFHSIPGMEGYDAKLDQIRSRQERFVARMLEESLKYPNILYCMDNETSTAPRWGQYWMGFIRAKAAEAGVPVFTTDMFDDAWNPTKSGKLRMALDDPATYPFLDVSQVNSRTFNEDHWNNIFWIAQQREAHPRPLNHTKIYSDGQFSFGTGLPQDGVERFWRNLIAGSASVRFHRPTAGIGLNDVAKACIRAARKIESEVPFWEVRPAMGLLGRRETDEAYLAADPGRKYLLYFTDGGEVDLDLSNAKGSFSLKWVNVDTGDWGDTTTILAASRVAIAAPSRGNWAASLTKR